MEKQMETTIVYRASIGIMEKQLETTNLWRHRLVQPCRGRKRGPRLEKS